MERHYLEEDLQMIQRYFPGAKTVNLRTPFDIRVFNNPRIAAEPDAYRAPKRGRWLGSVAWGQL